jgi:hypothetical protein
MIARVLGAFGSVVAVVVLVVVIASGGHAATHHPAAGHHAQVHVAAQLAKAAAKAPRVMHKVPGARAVAAAARAGGNGNGNQRSSSSNRDSGSRDSAGLPWLGSSDSGDSGLAGWGW